MRKLLFVLVAVIALASCGATKEFVGKTVIPEQSFTFYVNYEDIRAEGCEVTENDVPEGAVSIGRLTRIVSFRREIIRKKRLNPKWKTRPVEKNTAGDMYITDLKKEPKYVYDIEIVGDYATDLKKLAADIANEAKRRGGKGIAKISVRLDKGTASVPEFIINGLIYR